MLAFLTLRFILKLAIATHRWSKRDIILTNIKDWAWTKLNLLYLSNDVLPADAPDRNLNFPDQRPLSLVADLRRRLDFEGVGRWRNNARVEAVADNHYLAWNFIFSSWFQAVKLFSLCCSALEQHSDRKFLSLYRNAIVCQRLQQILSEVWTCLSLYSTYITR